MSRVTDDKIYALGLLGQKGGKMQSIVGLQNKENVKLGAYTETAHELCAHLRDIAP